MWEAIVDWRSWRPRSTRGPWKSALSSLPMDLLRTPEAWQGRFRSRIWDVLCSFGVQGLMHTLDHTCVTLVSHAQQLLMPKRIEERNPCMSDPYVCRKLWTRRPEPHRCLNRSYYACSLYDSMVPRIEPNKQAKQEFDIAGKVRSYHSFLSHPNRAFLQRSRCNSI